MQPSAREKFVIKRSGCNQLVDKEKIRKRLTNLGADLNAEYINYDVVVEKVYSGIYSGVSTSELDSLAAETCAYMNILHPDYSKLAARIAVSNLHKSTSENIITVAETLRHYKDKVGRAAPMLAEDVYEIIMDNAELI